VDKFKLNAYVVNKNKEVLNDEIDSAYLRVGDKDLVVISFDNNTGELNIHSNQWVLKEISTDQAADDHNVNLTLVKK